MLKNWNYNFERLIGRFKNLNNQVDWNQTIVSMFNSFFTDSGFKKLPVLVLSPEKFKPIFDSLVFYNQETGMIGDKYSVKYHNENTDIIKIDDYELRVLNF